MRLDQFLKSTRLVLRRSQAQNICEAGAVEVNGKTAKSAKAVQVGDVITVRTEKRMFSVKVLAIPNSKQTSRKEASTFYELVGDFTKPPDIF
jgi:ribosomal 50S subunit-recycling heat shock protein